MEEDFDYYEALEVSKDASDHEIKKSYRKMALRWHPDKNPDNKDHAEAMFKRVSEAYQVLSDSNKRQIYNLHGKKGLASNNASPNTNRSHARKTHTANRRMHDPFSNGMGFSKFHSSAFDGFLFRDPFDIFKEFFGNNDPFADFFDDDPFFRDPFFSRSRQNHFNAFPAFSLFNSFESAPFHMIGMKKPHQRMLSSFSSSVKTPLSGNVNQSMTTYANVNGKSISTTKHIANGVETVSIFENGKLVKKTINGVEQQIEHAKSKEVPHITQAHKGAPKQQVRQHHIKVQHQPAQEADRQVNRSQYNAATHRTTHNPQRHNQQQEQRRRYQSEARPRRFTTVVEANHTPQKKQPSSRATSSQRVFHGMPTRIANVCQDNAVASDPNNRSRWFKDFKIR